MTKKKLPKMLRYLKYVIGLVAILVFGAGVVVAANYPPGKTVVVTISDSGFSPTKVSIKQGDTLLFKNIGKWQHWPASNIHPTHLIYPEFDPKKALNAGESWKFTFDKAGSWRFHDHVFPNYTGEITVTSQKRLLAGIILPVGAVDQLMGSVSVSFYHLMPGSGDKLLAKANIFDLVAGNLPQLKTLIALVGPQKVLVKLLQESGGGASLDCHQQSHQIGRLSYEVIGADAFKTTDHSCHSGYMHGAMEAFLKDKGTGDLGTKIPALCNSFENAFSQFECLHGVGHGVMAYQDYDLPKALQVCQTMSDQFATSSCYGGVFMENVVVAEGQGATPGHTTKWVSDDPQYPCNAVDKNNDIQVQCYMMQTSRMLDIYHYDFSKLIDGCNNAPEIMRHVCYQSYGRDAAGQVLRNPVKINEICLKVPNGFYQDCIQGSVYVIVEFWGTNMQDQPHGLCKVISSTADKDFCYRLVGGRLPQMFGQDLGKITHVCEYSETDYIQPCLQSAGLI